MTFVDLDFFKKCLSQGLVKSPFLEIGSAKVLGADMPNLSEIARDYGVEKVVGVDLNPGEGVDFTADFGLPYESFVKTWNQGKFSSVGMFSVLEHTFDPITVLRNALSCVAEGGNLIVATPVTWPIHNFPRDYNRLLPDWYEEFARLNKIKLLDDAFCWLSGEFGICRVHDLKEGDNYVLPTFLSRGKDHSPIRYWMSRAVHKLFNTYGRSHTFPHVAIGIVYRN
jgi:SAM-dependent methyltransferase